VKNHLVFWPSVFIHRFLVLNLNFQEKLEGAFGRIEGEKNNPQSQKKTHKKQNTKQKNPTTVCKTVLALNCKRNCETFCRLSYSSWKSAVNFR